MTTTTSPVVHRVEHDIVVEAPADAVYARLADVTGWPRLFAPTIHVDREATGPGTERIRIWATANGEPKTWASRRVLDPTERRIEFRQEVSAAPVAAMAGTWIIEAAGEHSCRVRLLHDYSAVDDDPASLRWIDDAVDGNSRSELASLKQRLEAAESADHEDLVLEFADTVRIDAPRRLVYDFLNEADAWVDRLAHVDRVVLTEDEPGLQTLEMDTRTKDGSVHTTKSVRICTPDSRIVYKQVIVPALMTVHTGRWELVEDGDATEATSHHTVVLRTDKITDILGPEADVADARAFVRQALSGNSRATLGYAKEYAEGQP